MSTLILHPPAPNFVELFDAEKSRLQQLLPFVEIHHIGSTAIPGLGGKGIIDILIAIPDWHEKDSVVDQLKSFGFTHIHPEENERIFLSRIGQTQAGDTHLHITYIGSPEYRILLAFRDRLLTDPKLVKEYGTLKKIWLKQAKGDRKIYSQLKSKWLEKLDLQSPTL